MKTLDEIYQLFCTYKEGLGREITENSYWGIRNYIKFSKEICYNEYFNQEVLNDWLTRRSGEPVSTHEKRISSIRQFLIFAQINKYASVVMPKVLTKRLPGKNQGRQTDRPLINTCISKYIGQYIDWIKSIGKYYEPDHSQLIRFNKEIAKRFPKEKTVKSYMIEEIFAIRQGERAHSCNQRNKPARMFLEFAKWKKYFDVVIPQPLKAKKVSPRLPHAFTDDELKLLFQNIDNMKPTYYEDAKWFKFRKIQVATLIRLLYSTGMRTNEARKLKRKNIDLENGIIDIEETKGYHQHRVALHPSMTKLLKIYDVEMDKIMPERIPFFPDIDGGFHQKQWQANVFRDIWNLISDEDARAYDLRSNYAVRNINSWQLGEPKWIDKFMYLSRSMGHCKLESTAYYYQLVPMFREKMQQQSGKNIEKLIPNMKDFLEDEYEN